VSVAMMKKRKSLGEDTCVELHSASGKRARRDVGVAGENWRDGIVGFGTDSESTWTCILQSSDGVLDAAVEPDCERETVSERNLLVAEEAVATALFKNDLCQAVQGYIAAPGLCASLEDQQQLCALEVAAKNITEQIRGLQCAAHHNSQLRRFSVWLSMDLQETFGVRPKLLHDLDLESGEKGNVCFQFSFEENVIVRENLVFDQFLQSLPVEFMTRHFNSCVTLKKKDALPTARRGCFALNWLMDDRVRHLFSDSSLNCHRMGLLSLEDLLVELAEFAVQTLTNTCFCCLQCGKPFDMIVSGPFTCGDRACVFQSRELGLGLSIEEEILKRPEVVELLLTFFSCSMLSRRSIDLQAMPFRIVNRSLSCAGKEYDFSSKELSQNELMLFYALNYVPSVQEMQKLVRAGALRDYLNRIDHHLYPLLIWLIGGCRSFIRCLKGEELFKDMCTPHQFVIDCAPVEREIEFQKQQLDCGTFFAFHGSSSFAWNSIIGSGLKNLSNTENMSYGARRGKGIYVTTSFHTSLNYAKPTKLPQPWLQSTLGRHPRAVALCEIVNRPEEFVYSEQKCFTDCDPVERAQGRLHVIAQEEFIQMRYLFIYNENHPPPNFTNQIFALRAQELQKLATVGIRKEQTASPRFTQRRIFSDSEQEIVAQCAVSKIPHLKRQLKRKTHIARDFVIPRRCKDPEDFALRSFRKECLATQVTKAEEAVLSERCDELQAAILSHHRK